MNTSLKTDLEGLSAHWKEQARQHLVNTRCGPVDNGIAQGRSICALELNEVLDKYEVHEVPAADVEDMIARFDAANARFREANAQIIDLGRSLVADLSTPAVKEYRRLRADLNDLVKVLGNITRAEPSYLAAVKDIHRRLVTILEAPVV